jgi:hypothetical protein
MENLDLCLQNFAKSNFGCWLQVKAFNLKRGFCRTTHGEKKTLPNIDRSKTE